MTEDLELRWRTEQIFIELRRLIWDPKASPPLSEGITERDWYNSVAPHTVCCATEKMDIDCRRLNFDGMRLGDILLNCVLDYSSAVNATFEGTCMQGASLRGCNMRGSRFLVAQMSPIYAFQANFSNCEFDRCFLMGTSPRNHKDPWGVPVKAPYSDLRSCNFTGLKACKTVFERCDFKGADLSNAHFADCSFSSSDLAQVVLHDTSFERCDFDRAWLDDTPEVRALVGRGGNKNLDAIVWLNPSVKYS